MKNIRRLINILVLTLAGLYLVIFVLLHVPAVKAYLGGVAAGLIAEKLGTEVTIGRVEVSLFNRVTLDDVRILDQQKRPMFFSSRLSVNADFFDLLRDRSKISINSIQLFGLDLALSRPSASEPLNVQFALDSLASKDTTSQKPLDLSIASIIIRNGKVSYQQKDAPQTPGRFNPQHVAVSEISTHIVLDRLTDDSLRLNVKSVSFCETEGFQLKRLSFALAAGKHNATLRDLALQLPSSSLNIPSLSASYDIDNKVLSDFSATLSESKITPCDLATFVPRVEPFCNTLSLSFEAEGNGREIALRNISLRDGEQLNIAADAYTSFPALQRWAIDLKQLTTSSAYVASLLSSVLPETQIPSAIEKLGNLSLTAKGNGEGTTTLSLQADMKTEIGEASLKLSKNNNTVSMLAETPGLNLKELLNDAQFGNIAGNIDATAVLAGNTLQTVKGEVEVKDFDFNSNRYSSILFAGTYTPQGVEGSGSVSGQGVDLDIAGSYNFDGSSTQIDAQVRNFEPAALKIPQLDFDGRYSANIKADIAGLDFNSIEGSIDVTDVRIQRKDVDYSLNRFFVTKSQIGDFQDIKIRGDFAHADISGQFDYSTLASSVVAALAEKIPTLPGLPEVKPASNKVKITARLFHTDWLQEFFNVPIEIDRPVSLLADIDDSNHELEVSLEMPDFIVDGNAFLNGYAHIFNADDSLKAFINLDLPRKEGPATKFNLKANASNDHLFTRLAFEDRGSSPLRGVVNADASFFDGADGNPAARIHVLPSEVMVNDSLWRILSSEISYVDGKLDFSNLRITHDNQYILVDGRVADSENDYISVELNDVNVESILGVVKFDDVSFAGNAYGRANIHNILHNPEIDADLTVRNFHFEHGHFGDLYAHASWQMNEGDIMVDAVARHPDGSRMPITGFISPKRDELYLDVRPQNMNLNFVSTYTDDFLSDVDLRGTGQVIVAGPFSGIDLAGKVCASGSIHVPALNTDYFLRSDTILLTEGDIHFASDTIYDRHGNRGIVDGHLFHRHLGHISYAFDIAAQNLLGFDTNSFGEDSFYGTAFVDGSCFINGGSGATNIDITCTPRPGTRFVYNVTTPDAIGGDDFVHWNDRTKVHETVENEEQPKHYLRSDLKINFDINATPDLTLELLMDPSNGDYISLNGTGNILANYYNKGAFTLFGNYLVDHGIYRLTIQNVIRRVFEFQDGGTISFNGDANNADLNLQALYTVNGVSLSELQVGRSFTTNNIRVNCLMDITGTPFDPKIDFSFDMPTVSADIKSMVNSLVNSEEEMNQQVLYLLAVGRFYNGNNNFNSGDAARQSQASLAMQSILSGTVSQQLSTILSDVVNDSKWNLGANISTGDEGLYNAEYEGLVSGRLLNDRLLVNGQFGYRDNPNATSSFIGDFDIRYLLMPNGNASLKIYNQTNDKYFTKNSLNTQGIGLLLKKDFNYFWEFLPFLKK